MAAPSLKSLSEVVHKHPELCVNPLFWTSTLLDVLGCPFEDVARPSDETKPFHAGGEGTKQRDDANKTGSYAYWQSQSEAEQLAESFARSSAPKLKNIAIAKILTSEGSIFKTIW